MAANRSKIVIHPAFVRARDDLARALQTQIDGQLIYICGLSGSGKSEIRYANMRSFAGDPTMWGAGELPVISVRAAPVNRSYFNTKEFISRMYLELAEPNLDWLRDRSTVDDPDRGHAFAEERLRSQLWMAAYMKKPEHQIRTFVERTAIARHLRSIFVEESASLTYNFERKSACDHMVSYMVMAEEIKISLALFGVPKMAALWEGNAEILRRSRFVWVDRYRLDISEDRRNFERLAVSAASQYRFANKALVGRALDLAYACSAGVFGEVLAYYRRADDIRASEGEFAITKAHLEKAVSTEQVLNTLHREAAIFDELRKPASSKFIGQMLR